VSEHSEGSRRFPRLRARCRVQVRDRYGVWEAETEDLGPRGCRIVGPRPPTAGALVSLTVESRSLAEKLEVAGQVVWVSGGRPARAGISFAGSASSGAVAPAAWFEALGAARETVEEEARRGALALVRPEEARRGALALVRPPETRAEAAARIELAQRLLERARALVGAGEAAAAEVILRRALALAPGDPALEALLREVTAAGTR
jgi:hypothetical protein